VSVTSSTLNVAGGDGGEVSLGKAGDILLSSDFVNLVNRSGRRRRSY
jgi:hypothetical protein